MQNVLVSGAGIAGLTLAHWLHRHGFTTTVVEQAPRMRPGGQAIDVRGSALDVLDRMGMSADARRARTRMRGMSMLDADGSELWRSTDMTISSGALDGDDIEILRDDLAGLLHLQLRDNVEFLFGNSITHLEEDASGIRATFENGPDRRFDLVVGADGLHSTVRRLTFGDESQFIHPLGAHVAVFGTDNFLELDNWQVWLQDDSASYCVYPVRQNTEIRATLGFMSPSMHYDRRDTDRQKHLLAERMAHLKGDTPALLERMWEAPDFYFDVMAQIRMEHWAMGRTVLIGDAGYCPSPMSGQGTSLAIVGAYVLAAELADNPDDHAAATGRYETRMRRFVELNQALATENPGQGASEESIHAAKTAIALDAP